MNAVADKGLLKSAAKGLSLDKLPLLGDLINQVATFGAERMRERCPTAILLRPRGMASDKEEKILAAFDQQLLAFILHDHEWDCRIAVVLDQDTIFTLVEALLGSDGSDEPFKEARPFSAIERGVAKSFVEVITDGLNRQLSPMSQARFELEKINQRLDFVYLGARNEDAVLTRIGIEALGRGGEMSIVFPQVAIERVRPHLAKAATAEPAKNADPRWSQEFGQRVGRAEVLVEASVVVEGFCLGDIATMVPGQVLPMGDQAQRQLALTSEGEMLARCELGQSDGYYSIRIISDHADDEAHGRPAMAFADE
ncbi:MAG: FliM/FliN family flagellar motor switch protein [Beijerinckiaceae bacterium]|nr:FliM/FliN family flagellar motor switch protein [Beijerinckiaceae bacterium]